MFSNKSTDDLLANLEDELTEVIELSSPKRIFQEIAEIEKGIESDKEILNAKEMMPPKPARRALSQSTQALAHPVPVARRLQGKSEKNDENEIIQLSSMSSSSVSENNKNVSQNTVVIAKKVKPFTSNIVEVHESDIVEEKFFVTKHGKWAEDEKAEATIAETEVNDPPAMSPVKVEQPKPNLEIISEKPRKKSSNRRGTSCMSSTTQTSHESSSESSSTSEESSIAKKKSKKQKHKDKKKSKKKRSSDDQASSTEASGKAKLDSGQTIGKQSFLRVMLVDKIKIFA